MPLKMIRNHPKPIKPKAFHGFSMLFCSASQATIEQDSMRYKNMKTKPWLDAEGKMLWSPLQIRLAKIIFSQSFETLMGRSG